MQSATVHIRQYTNSSQNFAESRSSSVPLFVPHNHSLILQILVVVCILMFSSIVMADEIAAPSGDVVLTISGNLSKSNTSEGLQLDLAMIESLPSTSFKTETPWTDGLTEWEGVRLNDLLKYMGASSDRFFLTALDDYEVTFENIDIDKYPIIVAYKQDGEYMSVRNLGPLWIMFPFTDFPELDVQFNRALCIWQLTKMDIL